MKISATLFWDISMRSSVYVGMNLDRFFRRGRGENEFLRNVVEGLTHHRLQHILKTITLLSL